VVDDDPYYCHWYSWVGLSRSILLVLQLVVPAEAAHWIAPMPAVTVVGEEVVVAVMSQRCRDECRAAAMTTRESPLHRNCRYLPNAYR
jgi:hypothetical protein